ncbi:hypothetical protein BU26DRAFT_267925 [Trematosphaeria pertusa]|uniref:FAD-binding FR-type domain-containing protein n=1 Tax=Trematosphaeria pertusa TaxID=390896 RepID=A0A6A6IJR2_9PLEO|nr:uncharacterized protein BU26DRAFT_267925 [Trematosphaeria pertusa]KAF2250651.1 hypothetical protein BU26DRAFT_267925 [Trematosphaeria pertusa]
MSWLIRIRPGVLVVFGSSAIGGAAYRHFKPGSAEASLNPHTFTPYTLVDKQDVSDTSAIFTLRHRDGAPDPESVKEAWKRSVWSVQVKQPQLQIARAYTLLPPKTDGIQAGEKEAEDVRLLIREEEGGEVSTYLHRLAEKSTIELRGPNVECELPHDIKEVLFLAGGTGIAPAMQVAQALGRRTGSKMHILWANRRREECIGGVSDEHIPANPIIHSGTSWWRSLIGLGHTAAPQAVVDKHSSQGKGVLVQELEALKECSQAGTRGLSVQYYVDAEKTFIKPGDVAKRLHVEGPEEKGSRLILVSGPDGFIEHWAGKKLWVGGREVQGEIGGVLGQMDLKDWNVFKL